MRTMRLGTSDLEIPVVAVGCMRLDALDRREAERFVHAALEEGARFFDHADIHGGGACEEIFADAVGMNDRVRRPRRARRVSLRTERTRGGRRVVPR